MEISAQQVKALREKTGAGMMDCKKALVETEGDEQKAIDLLREKGILKAAKKADRIAAEGLVDIYISDDKKVGAVVEVNSETDFVAKNQEFRDFVKDVVKQIALENPKDVEELLASKSISDKNNTVQEVLTSKIATIGENLSIRRFERFETKGTLGHYIHGNGTIAVMVDTDGASEELGEDLCMQICASKPEYLDENSVPAERLEKEKEVLKQQVINEGKPENIAEKIVQGRIGKFYSEICLVDQEYVKNPDIKVKELLAQNKVTVNRFVRFEKGEGLQKREENFADEVAAQLK
jgi:elongation factor Ts